MHKKEDFKDLNMLEEIAYSIACLEKLCLEWNIKSKKLVACIEIFWGFTKKDIDCWEEDIYSIKRNLKNIERYELNNIDEEKKQSIANIIDKILKISLTNLYTRYSYKSAVEDILSIEKELEKSKIDCPDLNDYMRNEKLRQSDFINLRYDKYNLINSISFKEK
ncbi:hypothetical protein [Clostridium sp. CH2]|uniref:hypothetical protein n=1 Tax=Clostridium sp. CH2 TaxID=2949990 RepID=UPI00207AEAB7|nr:hypothetical protein [Clostridium sp. CH2]